MPTFAYSLLRPLLFCLDAETAHDVTLAALAATQHTPLSALYHYPRVEDPVELAGLRFPNRVGLAAGLDKNARCIDAFGRMGFGFIEVGTVTPLAQAGNPKPRIFRLPKAEALINRLGFNNEGLDSFIRNVQRSRYQAQGGILGLNIGKNATTPIERATEDYVVALRGVYPYADYITINISSPNTQNLRDLQNDAALESLLNSLCEARLKLIQESNTLSKPLFVKIAPDLDEVQITAICKTIKNTGVDGIIATNTTLSRSAVTGLPHATQAGGLSGAPVFEASNRVIAALRSHLSKPFPIIGVGGIQSPKDAATKLQAGADLVQIYTGLIYKGPTLAQQCAERLRTDYQTL